MRILHLSDTPLSGAIIRLSQLLNKHAEGVESRYVCWQKKIGYRIYPFDVEGSIASDDLLRDLLQWADIIHYHNRWKRQSIFKRLQCPPPPKPGLIQIHSPRDSEDFREEVACGLPIACVAQYHPRQWPECRYIVPNVVDITEEIYTPRFLSHDEDRAWRLPIVSYAPSNTNGRGWNDKGYAQINPILKRMRFAGEITYDLLTHRPFEEVIREKKSADVGIDDVKTGSYHLSALEYLALGIPCICFIDEQTEAVVKTLTGADTLPFVNTSKDGFERVLRRLIKWEESRQEGFLARMWMQKYWAPKQLCEPYLNLYRSL